MRTTFNIAKETRPLSSSRDYAIELARELADCASVLDVGCGVRSPLRFLSCEWLVGADAYHPDIVRAREAGTHDEFHLLDARELGRYFRERQFDACVALDVLEHFSKDDGLAFLRTLETLAVCKVVVFTPNGFLPQAGIVEGDFQEHLSGWTPQEMRALGYRVIGLVGLQCLRSEGHQLRFRPRKAWGVISFCTQHLWCRAHPENAAAILCVKDVGHPPGQSTERARRQ